MIELHLILGLFERRTTQRGSQVAKSAVCRRKGLRFFLPFYLKNKKRRYAPFTLGEGMGPLKLWPDFSDDGKLYTFSNISAAAGIVRITQLSSYWLGRRYGPFRHK